MRITLADVIRAGLLRRRSRGRDPSRSVDQPAPMVSISLYDVMRLGLIRCRNGRRLLCIREDVPPVPDRPISWSRPSDPALVIQVWDARGRFRGWCRRAEPQSNYSSPPFGGEGTRGPGPGDGAG